MLFAELCKLFVLPSCVNRAKAQRVFTAPTPSFEISQLDYHLVPVSYCTILHHPIHCLPRSMKTTFHLRFGKGIIWAPSKGPSAKKSARTLHGGHLSYSGWSQNRGAYGGSCSQSPWGERYYNMAWGSHSRSCCADMRKMG